jgi:uncharacterized membrane protein YjjP (DUF1212 family)
MNNTFPTQEHKFLIDLTRIGYNYGASLNRLGATLKQLGNTFGLNVDIISGGDRAQMIFWPEAEAEDETQQYSYSLKLPEPMPELNKLVFLQELVDQVHTGDVSPKAGLARIAEIRKLPALYGVLITFVAFALVGAAVAVMFGSPWTDVVLGGLMGLVAFALVMLAGRYPWVARSRVFLTGFVPAVLASILAATLFPGSNPFVLIISAVAVDIPGVILMLGLTEILLHQTVSGINRLVDGLVVVVQLVGGAALGLAIANYFLDVPTPESAAIPTIVLWVFIALMIFAAALIFNVRLVHIGWVILIGLLVYISMTAGNQLGFWQGPFIGAFVLGILSNAFSRWRKLPATLVSFPSMLSLMPGVLAYLGLFDTAAIGLEHIPTVAWQLFITFVAIVIGLVVANTLVSPRVTL